MDFSFIWQAFVLILSGILLLRVAGRKSISQMTLGQTVVMISLGTIIVQPIVEKSLIKAVIGATIFVLSILLLEYLQVKFNKVEKFITGKSKIVIENGQLQVKNLKKLRLTVDQLEMRMRTNGISSISDVKIATIEPNGQLGYELNENAKPVTMGQLIKVMEEYLSVAPDPLSSNQQQVNKKENIFTEVKGESKNNPEFLH